MKRVYIADNFEIDVHYVFDLSSMLNRSTLTLTLHILMDFSIQIKAIRMGVSIIYFKGSHVFSIIVFFCLYGLFLP